MSDKYTLKHTFHMELDEFLPYLPTVKAQLEEYIKLYPSHTTLDLIMEGIQSGDFQLWIVIDNDTSECVMSVVTAIATMVATGASALNIYALAGRHLRVVAPMIDDIIAWGKKHHNITEAEIVGRPGIGRVLKDFGFKLEAVTMKRAV